MARAGLKKVTKMVRGKRGTVRRSYWMKSEQPKHKEGYLHSVGIGFKHGAISNLAGVHRIKDNTLRRAATGAHFWLAGADASHGRFRRMKDKFRLPTAAEGGKHGLATLAGFVAGKYAGRAVHEGARALWERRRGA